MKTNSRRLCAEKPRFWFSRNLATAIIFPDPCWKHFPLFKSLFEIFLAFMGTEKD
jgi:hypothetical protein